MASPVETHQECYDASNAEESADKVHASKTLSFGEANGVGSWWRLVPDCQNDKSNESEDADNQPDVALAVLREKLTVKRRRSERHEAHDNISNGDSALVGRYQFRDSSNGSQKLNTSDDS